MALPWQIVRVKNGCTINTAYDDDKPLLYCRESHAFQGAIIPEYYLSGSMPTRGDRLPLKLICCSCYSENDLVTNTQVEAISDRGGRSYLPICIDFLKDGVPVTFSKGERTNVLQANTEKKRKKTAKKVVSKKARRNESV